MKAADESQTEKDKVEKGARKSAEAEKQLNELEQRLAQTERMLNSILGQLDPLTNCVKSVAQEQKNEIMTQLQTIRSLMKKRGMDSSSAFPEGSSQGNLDKLIESLAAREAKPTEEAPPTCDELIGEEQAEDFLGAEPELQEEEEQNRGGEVEDMEREGEEEAPPILQEPWERGVENLGAVSEELPVCGELPVCEELAVSLRRRRTRPE
ncbi:Coiled-coil domain-containing protein 107 [Merluccius polli]|uniref:Coiled-coil domain-containing protein 107 n=1 Tax=Merluccius polli TaxID=89951 RepID=A0AA47N174_MERPO|nr:Coiled-coil domain-containing protein 107 [Merluccius polli]